MFYSKTPIISIFNTVKKRISINKSNQKKIKKLSQKDLQKKSFEFSYGEQDQIDLLSYSGLEEQGSYLVVGDTYVRTLFISGYPYVATTGFLNNLVNFNHNIDIAIHSEQVEPLIAIPKLQRKITELESTRRAMIKDGKIIGSELTDPLESAIALKNKIQRGQEKLFQVSLYMTLSADTLSELNKLTTVLETVMSTRLFYLKTALFQQIEGLQSILPRGENQLNQKRNLDSSSAALMFPFVSSEFVQEEGILYGINKSNNSLVIVDRFSLNNANSIIFAQSGSGKSYTAKTEILRQLMQGTKVIVIDPEREYKQLTTSVNGTAIKLSTKSKEKINPFDFSTNSALDENNLSEHIQDLTEIIALMVGSLTDEEKAIMDKAILATYKQFGYSIKGQHAKKTKEFPLLLDLYRTLKTMKQQDLCDRLERFVKGSLSTVFDEQTNIALDNRLVVFDIKDLPESLRKIMLLVITSGARPITTIAPLTV